MFVDVIRGCIIIDGQYLVYFSEYADDVNRRHSRLRTLLSHTTVPNVPLDPIYGGLDVRSCLRSVAVSGSTTYQRDEIADASVVRALHLLGETPAMNTPATLGRPN